MRKGASCVAPPLEEWFSEGQQALDSTFGSLWDACMLCVCVCSSMHVWVYVNLGS